MTDDQAAAILLRASGVDGRKAGEIQARMWGHLLRDVDYDDALAAVDLHYTTSDKWLMPVHVIEGAKRITDARLGQQRRAELDAQIAAENGGELTDRERPLLALMAGSTIQSVPRPDWQVRHGKPPVKDRPPFTPEELKAAAKLLEAAKPSDGAA